MIGEMILKVIFFGYKGHFGGQCINVLLKGKLSYDMHKICIYIDLQIVTNMCSNEMHKTPTDLGLGANLRNSSFISAKSDTR
jgi:hypothetical protein